jgi:hypothetical protein
MPFCVVGMTNKCHYAHLLVGEMMAVSVTLDRLALNPRPFDLGLQCNLGL